MVSEITGRKEIFIIKVKHLQNLKQLSLLHTNQKKHLDSHYIITKYDYFCRKGRGGRVQRIGFRVQLTEYRVQSTENRVQSTTYHPDGFSFIRRWLISYAVSSLTSHPSPLIYLT